MNNYELYRRLAGLSQTEAAKELGVQQSAVSQWENGLTNPRSALLPTVAKLYGTTVSALLGAKETPATEGESNDEPHT